MYLILNLLLIGLTIASFYILISAGLTLIYGVLKVIHVAHGAVFAMGAYAAVLMFGAFPEIYLAILFGVGAATALGVALYFLVYSRLIRAEPLIPLIASIGAYYLLSNAFLFFFGPYILSFQNRPWFNPIDFGVARGTDFSLIAPGLAAASLIALWLVMTRTNYGLSLRAAAQDHTMALALGVNVRKLIIIVFALSSALAGLAGVLVGLYYNSVFPTVGDLAITEGLTIIVLGGMGSISGTVIASIVLAMSETFAAAYFPSVIPPSSIAFSVMIIILLIRPHGIRG